MRRPSLHRIGTAASLLIGVLAAAAAVVVPAIYLYHVDDAILDRWARVGEAMSVIGVFFSAVAFLVIAGTLVIQQRELSHQREELQLVQDEQRRSSEVALRQLHMETVKLAISDPDLLPVWPGTSASARQQKRDHYCNLILNLQKIAYEAGTIELDELRGALRYLMRSPEMYSFWERTRAARLAVTQGDKDEDMFTAEVDQAFAATRPPEPEATRPPDARTGRWLRRRR